MAMLLAKVILFTVLVPGTVVVAIPYSLLREHPVPRPGLPGLLGLLPLSLGVCVYLWCAWDFASTGRGTPAPIDPPRMLVVRGLYRAVRNPMYVGVLLILIGESMFFSSLAILRYTFVVWLMFHLFVVFYEEPTLRKKFGAAYEEYRRSVSRWIPHRPIPARP
jgi:protein-S-isoprenylcysteine O-methyltransferase Ste14